MAQVKVIFTFPSFISDNLSTPPPEHLVYVEWFTDFEATSRANHNFYMIKCSLDNGLQKASVIPISYIQRSIQLIPRFGHKCPEEWTHHNVLYLCDTFYTNSLSDHYVFYTIT